MYLRVDPLVMKTRRYFVMAEIDDVIGEKF